MKLLTASQMRALDTAAIDRFGIPGIVLMENASRAVFDVIVSAEENVEGTRPAVVCGKGNNGGDGFAVARHLFNCGSSPRVFLSAPPSGLEGDALTNYKICKKLGIPVEIVSTPKAAAKLTAALRKSDFIVDALLGTGVSGAPRPLYEKIISLINSSGKNVYSVDVPSGIIADDGRVPGCAVNAAHTITFGAPKAGLFIYPGAAHAGRIYIADIGLPAYLLENAKAAASLTTPSFARRLLLPPAPGAHKGDCGKVLVIGGSRGMSGAPALAGISALRTGAGLVYLAVPECIAGTVDRVFVEGITLPMPHEKGALSAECIPALVEKLKTVDAVVLGPGMSVTSGAREVVRAVIAAARVPVIIDADALNCLAGMDYPNILKKARAKFVLTPHPGEMARLCSATTSAVQAERLATAVRAAKESRCVVLLKGAGTIAASPAGDVFVNPSGNSGMATAGSGDVLSGITGALLAGGAGTLEAAACAAYVHGRAGDAAAAATGKRSVTAGDIARCLVLTIKQLGEDRIKS